MNRILITGGLGYIGSRIAQHLASDSNNYLILTTRNGNAKKPDWLVNGDLYTLNMLNIDEHHELLKNIDTVIHLAGVNEIACAQSPMDALHINSIASYKILELAIACNVKKFIYFSTIHVYGSPLAGILSEESLTKPVHPYSYTHRIVEDFITTANFQNRIQGITLRLSNSFGPPAYHSSDRWTLLVNDVCKQIVTKGEILLKSNGRQYRNFITLEDVSNAVEFFVKNDAIGLFNLGSENNLTILEMVKLIISRASIMFDQKFSININESDLSKEQKFNFEINKIQKIGLKLQSSFEKEIDGMLKYAKEYYV